MDTQDNAKDLGNAPSVVAGWRSIPADIFLFGLFIYNWVAKKNPKNDAAGHGYHRNRSIKSCQEVATVEPQ